MNDFPHLNNGGDHLDLILATSEIGIWELDAATGKALRNLRHDQIFGHNTLLDEWSAEIFLTYVFKEDRDRVETLLTKSLQDGKPWSFETRIRRADGIDRWISAKGMPKFSDTGDVTKLIGHVIDITETKQNEDRLKLLSKELNHRVANTFTIMNSMIRHAAKKTTTVEDFADTLMERLGALSRANRVLVAEEAQRSSLQDILDMEFEAFAGWRARIDITGDTLVWFSGEASEALAMIFHELLTNAVKHGALSVPTGQVNVRVGNGAGQRVSITWTETGGPPIAPERNSGIGSSILQNALREEGTVKVDYSAKGLICEIAVYDSFQREIPDTVVPSSTALPEGQPVDPDGAFSERKIMVVEDDPIIGMDIADIFRTRGASVVGPFTTVATALQALREAPDAALLDVNLGEETTDVIASQLSDLSIPFLILSGQMDSSDLGEAFQGVPIVGKPFGEQDLVRRVSALL
ncbi:HWE histidine kinase domain-containing protein [Aestuariibius sp. 2305UL40-4]|uniref:HWE histidine kinase domain-containing protein n=1 Tax=Aestuariibius violaceus TaxID=3234132 RepID=UPI00345E58F1